MQDFDWSLIPSFLAVLAHGSLSGAARHLRQSQPTVGRHVAELEAQLEVVLFHRTGRGYAPTPAALDLAPRATAMQDAAAAFSRGAEGQSDTVEGTVRVTASEVVATYILPHLIAELLHDEPALEIEVVASNSNENLLMREADIAIRMVTPSQPDLIARKIGDVEVGMFAHQDYLARMGTPERLEDLQAHIFLGYDRSELMLDGIRAFGVDVSRNDFRYRTDDQVAYVEAVAAGVGIGATMARVLNERASVVRVMDDMAIPSLPMWLVAHQELRTSVRVRRVFDFLADRLKEVCAQ